MRSGRRTPGDAFTAKFGRPIARSEDDVAPVDRMESDLTAG